jgi:tetratricopeptide (TPR) repeat protein
MVGASMPVVTMRRRTQLLLEYAAKGAFLALLFSLLASDAGRQEALIALAWPAGLFVLSVFVLAFRSGGLTEPWPPRLALALLHHTLPIYASILAGLAIGVKDPVGLRALAFAGAGVVIGIALRFALDPHARKLRIAGELIWVAVVAGIVYLLQRFNVVNFSQDPIVWTAVLLIGAALWYALLLSGQAEESELEIGLMFGAVAGALASAPLPTMTRALAFVVPVALFVVYAERIRRNVVAFKHGLRGLSYERQGDLRNALINYRLSLEIEPKSPLARQGNRRVHRKIDVSNFRNDPDLFEMIDARECLSRAQDILGRTDPTGDELREAHQLLALVEQKRDDLPWTLARERLKLLLANGQGDDAWTYVSRLLPLEVDEVLGVPDHEVEAIFGIWSLALKHLLLAGRGVDLLADDRGLFSFIAALERRLAQWKDDPDAAGFRPFAYERVTWTAFSGLHDSRPGDSLPWFGYDFIRDLGLAAANNEPRNYDRAEELLRIAAVGLPEQRLSIFSVLAKIHETKTGELGLHWLQEIETHADAFGVKNLPAAQQEVYFDAVRKLGDDARSRGDADTAIDKYERLLDSPKAGLGTLRTLQELHEQRGDALAAIRPVETALLYNLDGKEKSKWLAEKRRLYAQLDPKLTAERIAGGVRWFDVGFCFDEAHRAFDAKEHAEQIERWLQLAESAGVKRRLAISYFRGRLKLRNGDVAGAAEHLAEVCAAEPKALDLPQPEKRYFDACRLLADLYLDDLDKPEEAYQLLKKIERWSGSGADTLYKLGLVCERLGRPKEAKKWYEMTQVYSDHPKVGEARAALERLGSS